MNEQLDAIWNTLDALVLSLGLSKPDAQEMLKRNRTLMLTYADLVTQVRARDAAQPSQPANSAANGHKPAPTHA